MSDDLLALMKAKQTLVDDALRRLVQPESGCPDRLAEAMRYSLLAPGKRLRPFLLLLACEAAGGSDALALPAACAVEMIHTYSLIHDDLPAMDDDDLRRGLPTCHKKFDEATAILAGDALLTLAFQVLAEHYPPATAKRACLQLSRAAGAAGMVGGQAVDLAMQNQAGTVEALMALHARKTGALFQASLQLGLTAAQGERADGPDQALSRGLDSFGRCFGLVFQITDDLLDVEGDAEVTGKQVGKDAGRGKLTYPRLLGVAESRRRAAQLAQEAAEHLQPLGPAGRHLNSLFRFVLARDR